MAKKYVTLTATAKDSTATEPPQAHFGQWILTVVDFFFVVGLDSVIYVCAGALAIFVSIKITSCNAYPLWRRYTPNRIRLNVLYVFVLI